MKEYVDINAPSSPTDELKIARTRVLGYFGILLELVR